MIRPVDRVVSVAGQPLRIKASTEFALAAITPAIAHLPTATNLGSEETLWTIAEEDAAWRPSSFSELGTYRLSDGRGFAVVQDDPPIAESYRSAVGIEMRAGAKALSSGDFRAHPGSYSLAAWLGHRGIQVLHAGAVAYDGMAALIFGPSGAGKSTTVLACTKAGAAFLGEDLILVEAARTANVLFPTVHCFFATAKLNADSARKLGVMHWPALGTTPKDKIVLGVRDQVTVVTSARIVALIALGSVAAGRPSPQRLRAADVLSCLAPTAAPVACRTGSPRNWLATIATLVRETPAYRLPLSWDLEALGASVQSIIAEATARAANR